MDKVPIVMEANPIVKILSKDDEIKYWMSMTHRMYQGKEDAERAYQEYQDNSRLLEQELEISFEQSEKRNQELRQLNYKLSADNENLKNRFNEQIELYDNLQCEVQDLKLQNDQLLERIRKLEQKNDDLERFNREKSMSGEELETRCNNTLEKLAILETEMDEFENLKILVHRLQEENSDLKKELEFEKENRSIYKSIDNGSEESKCHELPSEHKSTTGDVLICRSNEYKVITDDVFSFPRQQEQKPKQKYFRKGHTATKISKEKLKMELNLALKKLTSLEKTLDEKGIEITNIRQQWKDEVQGWSAEVESRLQSYIDNDTEMSQISPSDEINNKENVRNYTLSRLNNHIRDRAIKVNEEAKRQRNLVWFLNRRYLLLTWLHKKK